MCPKSSDTCCPKKSNSEGRGDGVLQWQAHIAGNFQTVGDRHGADPSLKPLRNLTLLTPWLRIFSTWNMNEYISIALNLLVGIGYSRPRRHTLLQKGGLASRTEWWLAFNSSLPLSLVVVVLFLCQTQIAPSVTKALMETKNQNSNSYNKSKRVGTWQVKKNEIQRHRVLGFWHCLRLIGLWASFSYYEIGEGNSFVWSLAENNCFFLFFCFFTSLPVRIACPLSLQ